MTVLAELRVIGVPRPQGSKQAFVANGKPRVKDAAGTAGVQWRDAVSQAAKNLADHLLDTAEHSHNVPPFTGPLGLSVEFRFPMPKSRSKAQKQAGKILKTTAPDTSKLVRSLEDGLQAAGLIKDDALIARLGEITKVEVWDRWTGAMIVLTRETNP